MAANNKFRASIPVLVNYAEIFADHGFNVRAETGYEVSTLVHQLESEGQRKPLVLSRQANGKLKVLQGHRRHKAMGIIIASGKPLKDFDTGANIGQKVKAVVLEGLTPAEELRWLVDQGDERGLDKEELQNVFERFFTEGSETQEQIITRTVGLLERHYPPSRPLLKIGDKLADNTLATPQDVAKDLSKNFRNVIQTAKRAWLAPEVLNKAYKDKLANRKAWPLKNEMEELSKIHVDEMQADATNRITKANPGPKFLAKWEVVKATHEKAEAEGKTRGKASGMQNRQQTEQRKDGAKSWLGKIALAFQLGEYPAENYPKFDEILFQLESHLTDEQKAILMEVASDKAQANPEPEVTPEQQEIASDENATENV